MAAIDGTWLSKEGLTYFWSKIKAIFTKQTETNVIANLGAKNLFNIDGDTAVYQCTYTHADNILAITGTGSYARVAFPIALPAGEYIFTANADQLSVSGRVRFNTASAGSGTTIAPDIDITNQGSISQTISLEAETSFYVMFYSKVTSGTGESSAVYSKIMLRRAEITDDTFEPYAPTNRELYETRFASKTILPNNVDLNDIKAGGIYNGVNSTGNSAVHMPVATGSFNFVLTVIEANEFIIQIFKQLNSAGDPNFYVRRFYIYNSDWDSWYQFTGTQV